MVLLSLGSAAAQMHTGPSKDLQAVRRCKLTFRYLVERVAWPFKIIFRRTCVYVKVIARLKTTTLKDTSR